MTAQPYGSLDPATYQRHVRVAADGLRAGLARGAPDATVESCPGWTVRDLVEHLGRVHAWAGLIVTSGRRQRRSELPGLPEGADLASWYADQVDHLLATLGSTEPCRACWTHQPGHQVAAYWSRRQAHETAMHRVDVDLAVDLPARYDAELAVDGIGEVLDVWLPSAESDSSHAATGPLLLACTDRPERWLLRPRSDVAIQTEGPDLTDTQVAAASARIAGPAQSLLLVFWKRQDPDAAGITIDGDAGLATRFLASTLAP